MQDEAQVDFTDSSLLNNSADDTGGAIFLDTGEYVGATLSSTLVMNNLAKGQGCGTCARVSVYCQSTHT